MATLSVDQLDFFRAQKIPLSSVFDASGMRTADYQVAMKADGKSFAFGVVPCAKGGHSIRSRAGHCVQCDHAKIAYMLRADAKAYVYIAGSHKGAMLKIGSTLDVQDREKKLNEYRYGGQNDWQVLATANSPSAGRIESDAQAKLDKYSIPGEYTRAGRTQRCYELFRCSFADARDAVKAALGGGILRIPDEERALHVFNFLKP